MNRFEGKVVIVTGAGSGIGAATAKRFLTEGALVVLNGRRKEKLAETANGIDPKRVLLHDGDISDETYVTKLVAETVATFGRIDVLVNNAGIAAFGPIVKSTTEQWRVAGSAASVGSTSHMTICGRRMVHNCGRRSF